MSVEENKALALRMIDEGFNQGKLDVIDELVAPDFIEHEAFPGLPSTGPAAPRAAMGMFLEAFPDLHFAVDDIIGEGDKVVVRGTMSGTHKGEFLGIPGTNATFQAGLIDIIEFKDGKATQHWGQTDQAAMMEQLGIAPQ